MLPYLDCHYEIVSLRCGILPEPEGDRGDKLFKVFGGHGTIHRGYDPGRGRSVHCDGIPVEASAELLRIELAGLVHDQRQDVDHDELVHVGPLQPLWVEVSVQEGVVEAQQNQTRKQEQQ